MAQSEDSIQERDWQILHDRVTTILDQYGTKNFIGKGDYWLVDDNWGWNVQQVELQNLDLLRPAIVRELQDALAAYPTWRITIRVDGVGTEKDAPGMGIIICADEVIDELQRNFLPDRFRNLFFGIVPPPPESAESIAEKVRKLMRPK